MLVSRQAQRSRGTRVISAAGRASQAGVSKAADNTLSRHFSSSPDVRLEPGSRLSKGQFAVACFEDRPLQFFIVVHCRELREFINDILRRMQQKTGIRLG